MSERKEVVYVSHCDESGCSLGRAEYECPVCHRDCDCFDNLWWGRDAIRDGTPLEFKCPKCSAQLRAVYDEDQFDVFVEEVVSAA